MPFDRKAWVKKNRSQLLAEKQEWYKRNRSRILAKKNWLTPHARLLNKEASKRWRERHPEKKRIAALAWFRRNPIYANHIANFRRAMKLKATPPWVNRNAIEKVYAKAFKRKMHVDHIVPLVHSRVCGLHVQWNLQLLTPKKNFAKNNRWP